MGCKGRGRSREALISAGFLLVAACGQPRPVLDDECSGESCAAPTGVDFCLIDADCSAGAACAGGICIPGESGPTTCVGDQDCSVGLFCAVAAGICVECLESQHCDVGQRCNPAGSCVVGGCTGDDDCAPELCDESLGVCVECLADEDCLAGESCTGGTCGAIGPVDPPPTSGAAPAVGDLLINELLADPAGDDPSTAVVEGDANGDGVRGTYDDEFVELVNVSGGALDLADCTLTIKGTLRHRFPAAPGTTLVAVGQALVVFGGGVPTGSFGGARVMTASTGTMILANDGGWVALDCPGPAGALPVDRVDYGTGANDQSWTRAVEGSAAASLIKHLTVRGLPYSPGTCASGVAFPACLP